MSQLNIDSIANQLGTGGPDFVGMPSVDGDPVVESGSNSDGDWTRFADGYQVCSKRKVHAASRNEQRVQCNWPLPQWFLTASYSLVGNTDLNSIFNASWPLSNSNSLYPVTTETINRGDGRLYIHTPHTGVATNWSEVRVNAMAHGRWK